MTSRQNTILLNAYDHFQKGSYQNTVRLLNVLIGDGFVSPDILNLLGSTLIKLGNLEQAETVFLKSAELSPDHAQTFVHLGVYYRKLGLLDLSVKNFLKSYDLDNSEVQSLLNAGLLLQEQEKWKESERVFDLYNDIDGYSFEGRLGKAVARIALFDYDTGEEILNQLLAERPEDSLLQLNLADLYTKTKRKNKADKIFRQIIGDDFNLAERAFSMHLFSLGCWKEAFEYYEARPAVDELRTFCNHHNLTQWDGESSLSNQNVFVFAEQGVGDHIRYLLFLKYLQLEAKSVTFVGDTRLFPLINVSYSSIKCMDRDSITVETLYALNDHVFLSIASLGKVYSERLRERAISHGMPRSEASFLSMVPSGRSLPRISMDKPIVGVCWRSIKYNINRSDWYCSAKEFAWALNGVDAHFVSLQYGLTQEELDEFSSFGISLIKPENIDLKDDQYELAELISGLDAVVGVSTALTELAGAVAVPTYILAISDIRWFMSYKYISGFYPKAQVFYKERLTDWGDTLKKMSEALDRDLFCIEEKSE